MMPLLLSSTPLTPPSSSRFTVSPAKAAFEPLERLMIRCVVTYLGALRRSDALLCLPRHVRDHIFSYLLADYPQLRYIEMPDILDIWYPPFGYFNHLWYTETCQLIIQNATFSLSSDAAIINLMVFLNEFNTSEVLSEGYEKVQSLEFTDLSLFSKGMFSANSTKLLRRCPNIKSISLIIDMKELLWTTERGGQELFVDGIAINYDLAALTELAQLETVRLSLHPYMALSKHLRAMEQERDEVQTRTGCMLPGLDSFWGLKEWLELRALDQGRLIDVHCPSMDQFLPYGGQVGHRVV